MHSQVTHTEKEESTIWKLCIAYLANSFIVPVMAATSTTQGKQHFFTVGGEGSNPAAFGRAKGKLSDLMCPVLFISP